MRRNLWHLRALVAEARPAAQRRLLMPATRNRRSAVRCGIGLGAASLLVACWWMLTASQAQASKTEWSIFEDHPTLVRSGPIVREQNLETIKALGADTLRVEVKWAE